MTMTNNREEQIYKDDENIVITKDGHKYDWETEEEITPQGKEG